MTAADVREVLAIVRAEALEDLRRVRDDMRADLRALLRRLKP